jgi:glycosyltransferase involved in cell wall biosynthesis
MGSHIAVIGIKGLPSKGGAERVAEAICYKAVEQGFKVSVYAKHDYIDGFRSPNSRLKLIPIRYFHGKHLGAFSYGVLSTLHALVFGKYDLVHLHCADYGYLVPLLRMRFKVIATSHGAEYRRDKWGRIAKLCFRFSEVAFVKYSDMVTCVSESLADYYSKTFKKNIIYIPNGININKIDNIGETSLKKYNLTKGNYLLFCADRIIPSKGCDLLLKANKLLGLKIPLVIIGNREDDASYKQYLQGLADDNVIYIPFIKGKMELFELISHCKLFVFLPPMKLCQ